jgi:hypothetical protein
MEADINQGKVIVGESDKSTRPLFAVECGRVEQGDVGEVFNGTVLWRKSDHDQVMAWWRDGSPKFVQVMTGEDLVIAQGTAWLSSISKVIGTRDLPGTPAPMKANISIHF